MKPKAKTLIEKHGFVDPDRWLQSHDQIHLWALENLPDILKTLATKQCTFHIHEKRMEYPMFQSSPNYKSIVGFIDIYASGIVTDDVTGEQRSFEVYLEIKSRIPSCGELIRQIQFYKGYQSSWRTVWIVVSPDDRFQEVLREQGIYFYKYATNPPHPTAVGGAPDPELWPGQTTLGF